MIPEFSDLKAYPRDPGKIEQMGRYNVRRLAEQLSDAGIAPWRWKDYSNASFADQRRMYTEALAVYDRSDPKDPDAASPVEETEPSEGEASCEGGRDYGVHPVAAIFPMMTEQELQALAEDIKKNGQRDPIIVHEGQIVDGRNRLAACKIVGVKPWFEEWRGTGSISDWIISKNLHRRHLSDQQRALIAAKVKEMIQGGAIERSRSNLLQNKGSAERLDPACRSEGASAKRAADLLGVSVDSTKKADKVLRAGAPELIQAVQAEEVSLDAAAAVTGLPVEEQRKVVQTGKVKETAKALRVAKGKAKSKPEDRPAPPPASPVPTTEWQSMSSDEAVLFLIQELTAARSAFIETDEELVRAIDTALKALQEVQLNCGA